MAVTPEPPTVAADEAQATADDHIADAAAAHAASAVSVDPTGLVVITSTDAQAALEELDAQAGVAMPTIKGAQAPVGPIAAGGSASVVVAWDTPFPDALYTAVASVVQNDAGESLRVRRLQTVQAGSIVVNVVNNGITSASGTVHAIAVAAA